MKRMLINATQAEELRVAVVDGQKLLELEIEFSLRPEKKGNIYKGKVTRVEPSLDAVFVDYGEANNGFLPFKEISRQYFKEGKDPHKARVSDVITEGQEFLVQVEKDERGNKGAALSTFISLAGRYLVLMPDNPRAGGVSRRADANSRNEMREILDQLTVPDGIGLIVRTAGIGRDIQDLNWDLDYLKQLWQAIDGAGKAQSSPGLIYQESNLVIRAIRDYFQPDLHEILIDTKDVYDQATQFMSYVMPLFTSRVKLYTDSTPLFSRFQVETQIETAYSRTVNLPSGGSIVIDRTEALVAIDINSSRSTRGRDVEQTALSTNMEAAEEITRQLRLRDLGGLIVIDFIDMDSASNQRDVETYMRDALRYDRARIQVQRLSKFGLMEISRQRLRPSLGESSNVVCPRCAGAGNIRSTDSSALQALREIEEEALKENSGQVRIQLPVEVASFLLNEKRTDIGHIEIRSGVNIMVIPNKYLETPHYKIERLRHDELNDMIDNKTSYQLAEEIKPTEESDNRLSKPKTKPQVPIVKGLTHQKPAPIIKTTSGGLIAWIKNLFANSKPTATKPMADGDKNNRNSGRDRKAERGVRPARVNRITRNSTSRPRDGQARDNKRTSTPKNEPQKRNNTATNEKASNHDNNTPYREPRPPRAPRHEKPTNDNNQNTAKEATNPANATVVANPQENRGRTRTRATRAPQYAQNHRENNNDGAKNLAAKTALAKKANVPAPSAPNMTDTVKHEVATTIPLENKPIATASTVVTTEAVVVPPIKFEQKTPSASETVQEKLTTPPKAPAKKAKPITVPSHLKMVETSQTAVKDILATAPNLGRHVEKTVIAAKSDSLKQVETENLSS